MKDKLKDSGRKDITLVTKCRICQNNQLTEFFNLGEQPLANAFLREEDLTKPEACYPLRVLFCTNCHLVQLGEVVSPEILFRNYVYHSSGMPASQHFRDYAQAVVRDFIHSPDELAVEIGSNDGHFLAVVKEEHPRILGVDPAKNIAEIANQRGIPTLADFFSENLAREIVKQHGQAEVIVANNVVAHIDDHHDLTRGIKTLLAPDGVFVFEAPYLLDMFENLAFDTIYHEHMSYLALKPLMSLFEQYGLEIFRVELHPIQGLSFRVFVSRKGAYKVEPEVLELIQKEKRLGLHDLKAYLALAEKIKKLKEEVVGLIQNLKKQGKKIAAYGASARGNVVLNYYGLDNKIIDYATEELSSKIGLFTPGTHIPVVDVKWARQNPPDYYFLLAWNYKDVILEKEKEFREKGGQFIMPVGRQRII